MMYRRLVLRYCLGFLVLAILLGGVPPSVWAVVPHGVVEGDRIRYAVSASGSSPDIDPAIFTMDWFEFEYTEVLDSEVTMRSTVRYLNGTEDTITYSWDVLDGDEVWLIPSGLGTGDIIPWDNTAINATVMRSYIGASRTVNVVEFIYTEGSYSEQMWIYWDQATGLLLELTLEIQDGTALSMFQYLAVETNVWTIGLSLSLQLSTTTATVGETVSLSVLVTDTGGYPVDTASVSATLGTTTVPLTSLGSGSYQATLATTGLSKGGHTVTVSAQHASYPTTQSTTQLTLTLPALALTVTPHLSAASVGPGSPVTVTADVTDAMNASVTGAMVTATCGNLSILLTDLGTGTYQGTLATTTLNEGTHTVQVTVQKAGFPSTQAETPLTIAPAGLPWFYYLGFAGVLASLSVGALFWRRRRTPTPRGPSPPTTAPGPGGVMTQTMVTTTQPFHLGRIVGIGTGIVMLISVFLLPYTSTPDGTSLFAIVQPLLTNLNAVSTYPSELVAITYVVIIGFLLVAIGGVVGFFPLGSGVLGVIGMALLTFAPILIVNAPMQYRAFGLGFYLAWVGAIGGLVAAFLRSRRKTTVQTTQVAPPPTPTTTPPPPPREYPTRTETPAPPPPPPPRAPAAYPTRTVTPVPPPPPPTSTPSRPPMQPCLVCGGTTIWVPQHRRAYCTTCKEYR